MKKKHAILSLLILTLALLGCEKQDLPTFSNQQTLKNLRIELDWVDIVRKASFNEDGKIRNVILGNISTTEFDDVKREYLYTTNNQLECIPAFGPSDIPGCYPFLEYDNNGVLTTLNGRPLEYNGNIITELDLISDRRTVYEFEDQSYDELLKIEFIRDVSTNPTVYRREVFTYEGGNLITMRNTRLNDTTGEFELLNETVYTYDDKINPYKQGLDQIALVSYYQQMIYLGWNQFNLVYRSTNNVIVEDRTYENLDAFTSVTLNYSYEYNSNGYPVKRFHDIPSGEVVTKFEYYD